MAFDQSTRNRLQKFVSDARNLLTEEFTRQMQNDYGLDPRNGTIADTGTLRNLDDTRLETARVLRETLEHYTAASPGAETSDLLDRIVREQAFTVINRLAALRMAEARGFLIESLSQGYTSKGFQLYQKVAGSALGNIGEAYRTYLFSLFDEFSLDLRVLFDRFSPFGRLFPREAALLGLLELINHHEVAPLWNEDETIGWIYQYFNSKDERKKMRDESAAPRNSRELAVRNQFFTPRYVVEFLTDNTLGRTWYEMTKGETALVENCRYLVRRPNEVFLDFHFPRSSWIKAATQGDFSQMPENPSFEDLDEFAILINGYKTAERLGYEDVFRVEHDVTSNLEKDGSLPDDALILWMTLFAYQRSFRHAFSTSEEDQSVKNYRAIYEKLREQLNSKSEENLSQEELLKQTVFVPHREMKDPREILMLDPACGSMHFGLYAFDLFLTIYEEAWDLEDSNVGDDIKRSNNLASLHDTYENDREAFLRDVPRLIIENNIHGVDIDPRAVQIAGLSLWLRAQRAWQELGVKPLERPQIRRSNIVCAEPMPGEIDLLEEFIAKHFSDTPEKRLLGEFVRRIFDSMKLAGEAGSLLKIEEEVAGLISESREQWRKLQEKAEEKPVLFDYAPVNPQASLDFQVGAITDENFWDRAESEIYKALRRYSEAGEDGAGYGRRLFAHDAAQGFAFIDLCRKKYDAVLMNPPFGEASQNTLQILKEKFPITYSNIGAAFVENATSVLNDNSGLGVIIDAATSVRSSYKDFRIEVLYGKLALKGYSSLGWNVLDANVEACCYVGFTSNENNPLIPCFDLTDETKKGEILESSCVAAPYTINSKNFAWVEAEEFSHFPNGVPNFTLLQSLRKVFVNHEALGESLAKVCTGLSSGDNSRFYKLYWEPNPFEIGINKRWQLLSNGGEFSPFYRQFVEVIDWKRNGEIITQNSGAFIRNRGFYFSKGLSYGKRGEFLSIHTQPEQRIFTNEGQAIFPVDGSYNLYILGVLNSKLCRTLINEYCGQHKENGYVSLLPILNPSKIDKEEISNLVEQILFIIRAEHRKLIEHQESIGLFNFCDSFASYFSQSEKLELKQKLDELEKELNNKFFKMYGLSFEAIDYIESKTEKMSSIYNAQFRNELELINVTTTILNQLVGYIFGRWDVRFATGEKSAPELSDPFAPLPVCPPGMLQNAEGLPAAPEDVPADYPLDIVWNGILVDDAGNRDDVENRLRDVLQVIWKERAEAIETEAYEILGVRSLRDYFRKPSGFFADHLKRYSKSRRQAPIYLPLSTRSGEYTLWLYYHRLTDQTLYTCVNDYVEPKLKAVQEEANILRAKPSRSTEEEQRFEKSQDFAFELEELRDELLRLAPVWKPNLNDGVQITCAPLWKLFGLAKWQKTLKETWQKLEKGDYDWAHLAYSLYPDRVREKCRKDKSLAIAHDLEDLYVEPPAKAKKKTAVKVIKAQIDLEGLEE